MNKNLTISSPKTNKESSYGASSLKKNLLT